MLAGSVQESKQEDILVPGGREFPALSALCFLCPQCCDEHCCVSLQECERGNKKQWFSYQTLSWHALSASSSARKREDGLCGWGQW